MIKLAWNNQTSCGDLVFDGGIQQGDELETAILLSLFTWRRAEPDDDVPDKFNRLGFWGDTYPDVPGDLFGSRLWLLDGKKANAETLVLADTLVREALQWMLEDGVASAIEPEISRGAGDQLQINLWIERPGDLAPKYYQIWEGVIDG